MEWVGVACTLCSLVTLVVLVPALLAATRTPFYTHHAYSGAGPGHSARWTPGDYGHVIRCVDTVDTVDIYIC